jgi:hypothetical protein
MRYTTAFGRLASFAAVAALACSAVLAGGPLALFDPATRTPYAWPGAHPPVYTDLGGLGQLTNEQANAMVAFAVEQWDAVPTSSFGGTVAGDFASIGLPDIDTSNVFSVLGAWNGGGVHVIYDADGSITSMLFGDPYSVLGFTTIDWVGDSTPAILEVTMVLNGNAVPGDWVPPDEAAAMYAGVMTHEFGHAIGLAHSQTNGQIINYYTQFAGPADCSTPYSGWPGNDDQETMYPFINLNGSGVSASTVDVLDDMAALSDIYPGAGWPSAYPSIAGTIFVPEKAGSKTNLQFTGANVVARNVANPWKDAISAISGDHTQGQAGPDGTYAFHGLTPGASYVVYVNEILRGAFSTPSPTVLPGPEEYWNGAQESGDGVADDRCAWQTIQPTAGQSAVADIIFNTVKGGPEFIPVDLPNSGIEELSGDGQVAVGFSDYGVIRWTFAGPEVIGNYALAPSSGISRDGRNIVSSILDADGHEVAAMWQGGQSWLSMGSLPGSTACDAYLSSAWGVANNGTTVGLAWHDCTYVTGFRWTSAGGMVSLGSTGEGQGSRADKISADATTIVGWDASSWGGWRGTIWRNGQASIVHQTPALCCDGDPSCTTDVVGEANAVNPDGSIVIGTNYNIPRVYVDPWSGDVYHYCDSGPWRWTPSLGMAVSLGVFNPGSGVATNAFDLSDDGSVIVGRADDWWMGQLTPLLWTTSTGWTDFQAFIAAQGTSAPGWSLTSAGTVSGDGRTIAGWGYSPFSRQGWIVKMPKVVICHQPSSRHVPQDKKKTILVDFPGSMAEHLAHGDVIGLCGDGR